MPPYALALPEPSRGKLAAILDGEAPLDIFVRWKPIKDQAQGWHPDVNDGIRQNIRPFLLSGDVGKRGAGLFRAVPLKLKDSDRGNEPTRPKQEYPWFWCEDEPGTDPVGDEDFVGTRWNNVHLTLEKKKVESMNVLTAILDSFRDAANYNSHELAAPTVILWPDEERLWAEAIEALRVGYPLLWTLGEYDPDKAAGPAAWLRYQLETQQGADVPVIYLPGIGRSAFRSADQCPKAVTHLFALQFQGQFWTQKNGKDWTPFAFLSSAHGGLGLDVAADQETKKAIQECLTALLKVEVDHLKAGKLEASDFRELVTPDPARTLLRWMSDPIRVKQELEKAGAAWATFCAVCRKNYHLDPEKDGAITAAEKLTSGKGPWPTVWRRYKDAPRPYPGVKGVLESFSPAGLFEPPSEYRPQSNRKEEERLESDLLALAAVQQSEALVKIKAMAAEHGPRARWVWAALGESPLALAIGHLKELAEVIESTGNPCTWDALADYYSSIGWKADISVLRALNAARPNSACKAVVAAIRAAYIPWLEKLATFTQALATTYPTHGPTTCRVLPAQEGTVYLFADGMRMDVARSLEEKLLSSGTSVEIAFGFDWTALPTVTATAKSAWMPMAGKLGGPLEGIGFQAKESESGKALTHPRFKQIMTDLGITFVESTEVGSSSGCAWTEHGSIDTYGHDQGAKLAWRVDEELAGLEQRITELLKAGWSKVKVVTDHGWLMVPGGLPKTELPKHLTASLWKRCAIPGPGTLHGLPMTSWFWDSSDAVVLAPGISCFAAGMEYAHGGLTLQEALIPCLTIKAKHAGLTKSVVLKELKWSGLRLNVVLDGAQGLKVDVRGKVADAGTTFAASPVTAAGNGQKTTLLVPDDGALQRAAFLVVVDESGQVVFKHPVVIGES